LLKIKILRYLPTVYIEALWNIRLAGWSAPQADTTSSPGHVALQDELGKLPGSRYHNLRHWRENYVKHVNMYSEGPRHMNVLRLMIWYNMYL